MIWFCCVSAVANRRRLDGLTTISVSMRRVASDDVYLKDGHKIDKGTRLAVSNCWMWDSTFYEDPETFDAYRFVKLRQVLGREASANLASVSPEHMAFGLGSHACTGRFFCCESDEDCAVSYPFEV